MDWATEIADRYPVPAVPAFEYPRSDLPQDVEFVGPFLPGGVDDWTPAAWWDDVLAARAAGRPVVLVTQGTIATDPRNLVLPAVEALASERRAGRRDHGGLRPDQVVPADRRPANVRLTEFVPFTELLPLVDVMVTNGGYGGVQLAVAHGVPLVVAGTTEDKMEVSARVTWSGVGVALRTDTPSVEQVRSGVATVLADPRYRRAGEGDRRRLRRSPGGRPGRGVDPRGGRRARAHRVTRPGRRGRRAGPGDPAVVRGQRRARAAMCAATRLASRPAPPISIEAKAVWKSRPTKYRPGAALHDDAVAARIAVVPGDVGPHEPEVLPEPGAPDDVRDVEHRAVVEHRPPVVGADRARLGEVHAGGGEVGPPDPQQGRAAAPDRPAASGGRSACAP